MRTISDGCKPKSFRKIRLAVAWDSSNCWETLGNNKLRPSVILAQTAIIYASLREVLCLIGTYISSCHYWQTIEKNQQITKRIAKWPKRYFKIISFLLESLEFPQNFYVNCNDNWVNTFGRREHTKFFIYLRYIFTWFANISHFIHAFIHFYILSFILRWLLVSYFSFFLPFLATTHMYVCDIFVCHKWKEENWIIYFHANTKPTKKTKEKIEITCWVKRDIFIHRKEEKNFK